MKVYMLAAPELDYYAYSRFLVDENIAPAVATFTTIDAASRIAEIAGRVCYMSFGKGRKTNKEYLANIVAQKHFSVLEHANWTFLITGVSRSLTHELVRHRHFSFSQLSQRYVDESEAKMIQPPVIAAAGRDDVFHRSVVNAQMAYKILASGLEEQFAHIESPTERRKAARQAARAVLPNATETKIVVTGNARTWREFIEKRNSPHADPEIQALAQEVLKQLHESAPNMFADLVEAK